MSWLSWPLRILWFILWYIKEVFISNVNVLRDNLTPGQDSTPGIARCSTHCRTDLEVTTLAALITLTPGTLTLGVHNELAGTRVLYVHSLYLGNGDAVREDIADMERRLLHALRRGGSQR